jgi:hypothetical protein
MTPRRRPGTVGTHAGRGAAVQMSESFLVLFFKKEPEKKHFFFEKKKQKTFDYLSAP